MKRAFFTLVFCICFVKNSFGLPSLTCNDVHPISTSTVKCSCQNAGAPGINWYTGSVFLTQCTILSGQCFTSMGYTFTVNSTTSTYTIEFGSYSYTQCTNVTCSDSTTPSDSAFKHISVDAVSYIPTITAVNEPDSSHMNGNINFTTDCIYKTGSSYINATAIWKAVVNETEADKLDIDETISETGSCQFCSDDFASTFFVSFIHQEEQSDSRIKAKIRLLLYIDGITDPFRKTTENEYYVQVRSSPTENPCYCWCWFDKIYWCIIIIFILFGVPGVTLLSYIPAAVIYFNQNLSNKLLKGYNKRILLIPCRGLILIIRHKVPDMPQDFDYDQKKVTSKSVSLSWKPGKKLGPEHNFELTLYCDNTKQRSEIVWHDDTNVMHFDLYGLVAATAYTIKICAEYKNEKTICAKEVQFTTAHGLLSKYKENHQRIAGEDEICCENCKETGAAHASHALCLSHRLYLCLTCIGNEHKNEKCVLLWNTGDIEGKDHKLCCEKKYNYDDLQLKGVCQVECKADNRQTDKLFICSQCIKETEYPNSTSHQQLHGPLNTRVLMCCEKNKTTGGKKTVNFCIQCETYVCAYAPCLKKHKKHLLISSLKSDMDIKPSLYDKTRGVETDFCIQCKRFICASCLEPHPHNNHMVVTSLTGLVSARAGMCCKTGKNDFCIQCQTYLCLSCSIEHHSGHIVLSSLMDDSDVDKTIFCKGCESEKNLPIECLELTKKAFLCSSCYESRNPPEKTRENGEVGKSFIEHLNNKKREECQVHAVLGDEPHFVTDVYCLICKLYMCIGCYKKHRRLYEYWSKYLEGNLFYCNRCPTAGEVNLKPVECYDLQSLEFKCGKCYILNPKAGRNKTSYPQKIKSTMKIYTYKENQCKLHEDLPPNILSSHPSSTANVFCLVCKEYMCKTCFRFHVDRNPNATRNPPSLLG